MSILTSGRSTPCKDSVGGIKEIWLAGYVSYSLNVIQGYKDGTITSFPDTQMFRFYGKNKIVKEKLNDLGTYDVEIQMELINQDYLSAALLDDLTKKRVIALVIDRMGNNRLYGLFNGLDIDLESESGGSRFDFNGYRLVLTGKESYGTPSIAAFPGSGFSQEDLTLDCLLCSTDQPASLQDEIANCNIVT